ncbi:O-methyltransferase-domain-containing protein [Podospora appendiculata]|uniref:O-methyltransferase-domain-containing protein n=1 Tax=Podospora appendiculata TaxID=314037 RepID=A0AAE1C7X3_9PEZI|nr:O-methyltransferase-domain-containing protein [Podospora appendiculata]
MSLPQPPPSLVDLATAILQAATTLQDHLATHHLPQPDLSPTSRHDYLDILANPTATSARAALIETTRSLLHLAQGPTDLLRSIVLSDRTAVAVLRAIHALKIAEAVPLHTPISLDALATSLGVHPIPLSRMLRFAYTLRIFHEPDNMPNYVAHTALSAAIPGFDPYIWLTLSDTTQVQLAAYTFPLALRRWPTSPMALTDPRGRDWWTILQEDDPEGKGMDRFSAAMTTSLRGLHGAGNAYLLEGFDWAGLGSGTVVDVGGGSGHNAVAVAKAFPRLRVVVQDLPKNESLAVSNFEASGLMDEGWKGCKPEFQAQDFFSPQPGELRPKVYLLSRILHDWSDEDALRILTHLIPAMKKHGTRLLLVERVLPDRCGDIPLYQETQLRALDLLMYTTFGGGCERSASQWEQLLRRADAGLGIMEIRSRVGSELSMLEAGFCEEQGAVLQRAVAATSSEQPKL